MDDEPSVCEFLTQFLKAEGYKVNIAPDLAAAREILDNDQYELLIIDKNLPDGSGIDLAQEVRSRELDCETIIMTAFGNMQGAVEAMHLEIADYLRKPFTDLDDIRACLHRVKQKHTLKVENRQLRSQIELQNGSLAVRDPLTKLFNHALLHENLDRELARSKRDSLEFGFLLIDFDNFKSINEMFGHNAGDKLLRTFSELIRDSDQPKSSGFRLRSHDVAARYGHDVFALILTNTPRASAIAKAEQLRGFIANYDFSEIELGQQTVSLGVASFPEDANDHTTLVQAAERALSAAKRTGRNRIVAFHSSLPAMNVRGSEILETDANRLNALENSITEHAFDFVYQPIVRTEDGSHYAYEALCRPRNPNFPNPPSLIQAAERSGRIRILGRALRQCAIQEIEALPDTALLFINVHPHELHDPQLAAIESFLAPWAQRIVFEITEVAGIQDYERARDLLKRLRAPGFRIALDDLGAGYSGLSSLALLEPDYVKLDMGLIRNINRDARARRLIKHILEFAADEGMMAIAEGVETKEEREALIELGCPLQQGWYYGKGVPASEISKSDSSAP